MKIRLAILFGCLASIAVLWLTPLPLGISGEWTWERTPAEPDTVWNLVGGAVAAGFCIGFVLKGRRRFELCDHNTKFGLEHVAWLFGLVVTGFIWIWIVQEAAPTSNRIGKAAFVLYYPSSSGYFTRARYIQTSPLELLAGYEELMGEGDVLHTGTHPPGLILIFQGFIELCKSSESLSTMLDNSQPLSFRESCDVIANNALRGKIPRLLLPGDRRVLWLATVVVMFSVAMVVVPLFGLLRRHCSFANSWTCAAFWPAMPAVVIFIPKSDAAFPFLGVLFLWIWLTAWDKRSFMLGCLAGFTAWIGLMCSLAFLPVILAAATLSAGSVWMKKNPAIESPCSEASTPNFPPRITVRHLWCIVAAGLGISAPTLILWLTTRVNMISVWWMNYKNHGGFYEQNTRTYWKWLLFNPLELSFAAGWPITILAVLACVNLTKSFCCSRFQFFRRNAAREICSIIGIWGLLWLTGKNSGEAARLWIIFFPWLIWTASWQIESMTSELPDIEDRQKRAFFLLTLQFAICLTTVSRINGFS